MGRAAQGKLHGWEPDPPQEQSDGFHGNLSVGPHGAGSGPAGIREYERLPEFISCNIYEKNGRIEEAPVHRRIPRADLGSSDWWRNECGPPLISAFINPAWTFSSAGTRGDKFRRGPPEEGALKLGGGGGPWISTAQVPPALGEAPEGPPAAPPARPAGKEELAMTCELSRGGGGAAAC